MVNIWKFELDFIIFSVVESSGVGDIGHGLNFGRNDDIELWTNQNAEFEIDLF